MESSIQGRDEKQKLSIACNLEDELEFDLSAASPSESDASSVSPKDNKRRKKKKKKCKHGKASGCGEESKLTKSSTFPSSEPIQIPNRKAREYEDVQSARSASSNSSAFSSSRSCPSRSALRGGQEDFGLGPRPKLHVKWAQDVHDPPSSIVSHTLVQHRRSRNKKEQKQHRTKQGKSKAKETAKLKQERPSTPIIHTSSVVSDVPDCGEMEAGKSASAKPKSEEKSQLLEEHLQSALNLSDDSPTQSAFFALMEMATKHMVLGSKLITKSDFTDALAEYKAASHAFSVAKSNAEALPTEECEGATKQAIRGQVLAWIAMSTLYSASGEASKSQEYHDLALKACSDTGINFESGVKCVEALETSPIQHQHQHQQQRYKGRKNKCSSAALYNCGRDATGFAKAYPSWF